MEAAKKSSYLCVLVYMFGYRHMGMHKSAVCEYACAFCLHLCMWHSMYLENFQELALSFNLAETQSRVVSLAVSAVLCIPG